MQYSLTTEGDVQVRSTEEKKRRSLILKDLDRVSCVGRLAFCRDESCSDVLSCLSLLSLSPLPPPVLILCFSLTSLLSMLQQHICFYFLFLFLIPRFFLHFRSITSCLCLLLAPSPLPSFSPYVGLGRFTA